MCDRVLFGFWRGKRLRDVEPRLKAGGKYGGAEQEARGSHEGGQAEAVRLRQLAPGRVEPSKRELQPQPAPHDSGPKVYRTNNRRRRSRRALRVQDRMNAKRGRYRAHAQIRYTDRLVF